MNTEHTHRRDFLKICTLAGLGLYLPSCINSTKPTTEAEGETAIDDIPQEPVQQIIDLFQSENVVLLKRDDEQYEKMRGGFNLRVPRYPRLIALCKNNEGIAEAVKYAQQENLPVAIKSGGHSFESFSSNDDGLVINLSMMNQIEWIDEETVKIGPGCTLSQVYDEILPKKRIIPMGSCGGVGVGGLALGGGYGLFSRKYGLTCDNMTELTMIDGQGNIHEAKGDHDLLWACRGGGNGNFGVISEMTFKTHSAPSGFYSHRFKAYKLDVPRAKMLLETWFKHAPNLPPSCFSAFVLNGKTLTLLITNFEDDQQPLQYMFDAFKPITDKMSMGTKKELATSLRKYYGIANPLYFKNASAGLYKNFEDIASSIEEVIAKVGSTRGLIYQVNTLGGNINNADFEAISSYPHRSAPFLAELQAYYDNPDKQEKTLLTAFQEIQAIFKQNGVTAHYRNYPDINFTGWETAYYGEENYGKLQAIKRKYDPNNVIRHEQSVKI